MYKAISANKRNTVIIMAVFVGLIGGLGYLISWVGGGSPSVALWCIVGAAIYSIIQYFAATKLAVMSTGAIEIEKNDNPRLYRTVENLAITEGMPMPKVYVINDPAPNAFATGRDPKHALVAATTGLLEIMNDTELEGVLAHELSHIKNYDIRVSMIAFGLVSAVSILTDIGIRMALYSDNEDRNPIAVIVGVIAIILAPIMATMIQLAISRQREYLADSSGAMITRYPEGLASALEKLRDHSRPMRRANSSTSHLFFDNPLKSGFINKLFSSHPPLEKRIARLRNNANKF